jgi:nicotinamidase-related amidase
MPAPAKNLDLHGSAPDTSAAALLLVDVINDLEFEDGERLLESALPMAHALARLKRRCRRAGIPTIYVNDNAGRWREDQRSIVARCLGAEVRGRPVVELLVPDEEDYFVIKPKHSGFFSTPLDTLLAYLRAHTLILTGIGTNLCVLFTANDAYMRDYHLVVPADCVAAVDPADGDHALQQMQSVLDADTRVSTELDLREIAAFDGTGSGKTSRR